MCDYVFTQLFGKSYINLTIWPHLRRIKSEPLGVTPRYWYFGGENGDSNVQPGGEN